MNTARTWLEQPMSGLHQVTRGSDGNGAYLTECQGESSVLRAQDTNLDDPDPIDCGDRDDGPKFEERIICYYCSPTPGLAPNKPS